MNDGSRHFEGLLTRYFEDLLHAVPTLSVIAAGLPEGEGKLEQPSAQFYEERERARQKALQALEKPAKV